MPLLHSLLQMERTCCLLLLLALSIDGLAAVPQARQQRQQSSECQASLLQLQEDCNGLSLPDVDQEDNVDEALKAACTTQTCHEAISAAMTACTEDPELDPPTIRRANDLLLSFYCKKDSSGELCGELVLKSNVASLDEEGCAFISPATVPDTCPPQCTPLASILGQMFGCCWTEYVQYTMELLPTSMLPGISPNASELWSRCNAPDPGYCSSTLVMDEVTATATVQTDINSSGLPAESGQMSTVATMKLLLLLSVTLMTLLML